MFTKNTHLRLSTAGVLLSALLCASVALGQGGPDVLVNQDPPGRLQNETSLIQNPATPGNFVMAFNDNPYSGTLGLGVAHSTDFGATWLHQRLAMPLGYGFVDAFDPITAADTLGTMYAGYITSDGMHGGGTSAVVVHASTDGGATWTWQALADLAVDRFVDKPHMAADMYPASSYADSLYVTWIQENIAGPGPWSDICFTSAPPGMLPPAGVFAFNPFQVISDMASGVGMGNGPNIAVASDGTVYVAWLHTDVTQNGQLFGMLFLDASFDGGMTWGMDSPVRQILTLPDRLSDFSTLLSDVRARSFPCIETNPANPQEVYMVYAEDPDTAWAGDEADVYFIKSTDGGVTWLPPQTLNQFNGGHEFEPWISVKPDGTIDVAWYQSPPHDDGPQWSVVLTRSIDYGATWSTPVAINDTPFPSPTDPWGTPWMGEYLGLVTDNSDAYVAFTASTSAARSDTVGDVYFDDVVNADLIVPCDGDLNGDGAIGLSDLAQLLAYFGTPAGATYRMGDLDGDGDVDLSDLAGLLANYGMDCWVETFETYPPGSQLHGQGGWKGWGNDPSFGAFASNDYFHNDGALSVDVVDDTDLVREFGKFGVGEWVFSAWQYIPSYFVSGGGDLPGTYFIIMNTYTDNGPWDEEDWSVQMNFDSNDGMLKVYHGNGLNTVDVPYETDRWVKIEAIVNLDTDWTQIYYDDNLITEYSWTGGVTGVGGGALNIAAVDLFANGSSSVYYDDLRLMPH